MVGLAFTVRRREAHLPEMPQTRQYLLVRGRATITDDYQYDPCNTILNWAFE